MRAAGLPEIVGEGTVKIVAHADDQGLQQRASLPAGPGQGAQKRAPGSGPQGLEPWRRAKHRYIGCIDEGSPQRQGSCPCTLPGARCKRWPVQRDADGLAAYRLQNRPGSHRPATRSRPVIDTEAAGGSVPGSVSRERRRQFQVKAGHTAGCFSGVGADPALVPGHRQAGIVRKAGARAGCGGF